MSLVLANIIGWITAHWRIVLYIIGGVVLVIAFSMVWKSCNRPPKLDEKAIQKAQDAIATKDRAAMVEVLATSELIEKRIDANLANAETVKLNTLADARKKANAMTNDELAAELERRINQ